MAVVVQYVVKPNPGSDLAAITAMAKEAAALWRKHGGKVSYWSISVGELGNRVLSVSFDNYAAYGAAIDKRRADPAAQAWEAKRLKAGDVSLVRSNLATEIEI